MNTIVKINILYIGLSLVSFKTIAQNDLVAITGNTDSSSVEEYQSLLKPLPALSSLLDSALFNSTIIKKQDYILEQNKIELAIQKTSLLNGVSLSSFYNWGSGGTIVNGQNVSSQTIITNGYGVGVTAAIPINSILNYNREKQLKKLNYSIEEENKLQLRKDLEVVVNKLYLAVILKQKILRLKIDGYQSAQISHDLALIEFQQNIIGLNEYTELHEKFIQAQINIETVKSEYILAVVQLEQVVGMKLR